MKRIVVLSPILLAAAIVLLGPSSALAADCGGAVPCSCGDTVVADRTLVCGVDPITNPPPCAGDGLIVADGVTLDLGGCTIRGAAGGVGVELAMGMGLGSTVETGIIVGFERGVLVTGENGIVRTLRISQTSLFGIKIDGANSVVERNVLQNNHGVGIGVNPTGDDVMMQLNRIEDSAGCGVVVAGTALDPVEDISIARNVALRNGDCGIRLVHTLEGTLDRNSVRFTQTGPGFHLDHAGNLELSLNISSGAAEIDSHGYEVTATSTGNTFRRNVASGNNGFGFVDDSTDSGTSGTGNTYIQNNCSGNVRGNSSPPGLCQ